MFSKDEINLLLCHIIYTRENNESRSKQWCAYFVQRRIKEIIVLPQVNDKTTDPHLLLSIVVGILAYIPMPHLLPHLHYNHVYLEYP